MFIKICNHLDMHIFFVPPLFQIKLRSFMCMLVYLIVIADYIKIKHVSWDYFFTGNVYLSRYWLIGVVCDATRRDVYVSLFVRLLLDRQFCMYRTEK